LECGDSSPLSLVTDNKFLRKTESGDRSPHSKGVYTAMAGFS